MQLVEGEVDMQKGAACIAVFFYCSRVEFLEPKLILKL